MTKKMEKKDSTEVEKTGSETPKNDTLSFLNLQVAEYSKQISIDLTASIEECWDAARGHAEAHQRHFAAKGLYLLRIKEATEHGVFIEELERRGFETRTAQRAMAYARYVFSQPVNKQEQLLGMAVTKVCLLAQQDPEVVEALFEDGEERLSEISYRGLFNELKAMRKQLAAAMTAKNDEATINAALNKRRGLGELAPHTQAVRDEALAQQATADYGISALKKMWDEGLAEQHGTVEHRERLEFLWFAIHGAAARTQAVVESVENSAPFEMPTQISTAHMLTEEEREAFEGEWAAILGGIKSKEALRHERRQADLPKSVGRPKKQLIKD